MQFGLDLNVENSKFISAWDLTGGADYIATPHLNISTKSRALFTESNQLSDFLFAGSLNFDRNLNNKGLKLKASAKNIHTFEDNLMMIQKRNQNSFSNDLSQEWNFNTEIGYGMQFSDHQVLLILSAVIHVQIKMIILWRLELVSHSIQTFGLMHQ